jgi:hypothetical protein
MVEKYYLIKSSITNKNYYVSCIKEEKRRYKITIGGIKNRCVLLLLDLEFKNGAIQSIDYNPKCVIQSEKLKRGAEMIDLIKCSLTFAIKKFPQIEYYSLTDDSEILCNNKERISLANLYYCKYGKTWYQKELDAKEEEHSKNLIDIRREFIDKTLKMKFNMNYNDFINIYYKKDFNSNILDEIKKIFRTNISLKDFLEYFFKNNIDCKYYYSVINKIIGDGLRGTDWMINKERINSYSVKMKIIKLDNSIKFNNNLPILLNKLKVKRRTNGGALYLGII